MLTIFQKHKWAIAAVAGYGMMNYAFLRKVDQIIDGSKSTNPTVKDKDSHALDAKIESNPKPRF